MLNISNKTAKAARVLAKGMATAAPRIGDTKVPMSLLEKGAFINYQRIEDNLAIVRERCVLEANREGGFLNVLQASTTFDALGEDSIWAS